MKVKLLKRLRRRYDIYHDGSRYCVIDKIKKTAIGPERELLKSAICDMITFSEGVMFSITLYRRNRAKKQDRKNEEIYARYTEKQR